MEKDYIDNRHASIESHFRSLTRRIMNDTAFARTPTIAISGGGFRSMLSGAGVLGAYDARSPGADGELGGLLQSSTYLAGISGGLWIVISFFLNDGMQLYSILEDLKLDLQTPILEGVPNMELGNLREHLFQKDKTSMNAEVSESKLSSVITSIVKSIFSIGDDEGDSGIKSIIGFYKDISLEAKAKKDSGYRLSLIDYWARTLARKVLPTKFRSTGFTISSASKQLSFQNYSQPFPIITSVELIPNETVSSVDSHIIEISPFEFGSWDSFLNSFVSTKFLGSDLWNGTSLHLSLSLNASICTSGYDTVAFLAATSSGLFNTVFQYVYDFIPKIHHESSLYVTQILRIFGFSTLPTRNAAEFSEFAIYSPNPFRGVQSGERGRSVENSTSLFLADGGEDGQNIPFSPYLVPGRKVDAILAFDMGSEIDNRPSGLSLRSSAQRYHANQSELHIPLFKDPNGILRRIFPVVPSAAQYSLISQKPAFLGCEIEDFPAFKGNLLDNFKVYNNYTPPLTIYQANHDIVFEANTSTFKSVYSPDEVQGMFDNGYELAVNRMDLSYKECLWCALMKRASKTLPEVCDSCFNKYCYRAH